MSMPLKNRHLQRRKTIVAVLGLLVTSVALLLYKYSGGIVETTEPIELSREDFYTEYTSPACEEELKRAMSEYYVLQALIEDGFLPIALSNCIRPTASTATPNGNLTGTTDSIVSTELPSRNDTNQTGEFQFRGFSRNCTNHRIGLRKTKPLLVPNVVHYVFVGSDFQFKFITYLSFLSVERFLKPFHILIHGDVIPSGIWWNATVKQVKNIYHVQRSHPTKAPNGQPFKYMAHVSDYMRAEILFRYGGIYLDPDVLVLKSFRPLRQFPFVLGRETENSVCNGIMIARRDSMFLQLMFEQYWSYKGKDEQWATQSVHNVHKLAQVYPHLVHVEEKSLNRPNWIERSQIYAGHYNWTDNYAMHLWLRLWPKEKLPSGLDDVHSNTTFGEIARHILFGTY